jgi:hypothetical protein
MDVQAPTLAGLPANVTVVLGSAQYTAALVVPQVNATDGDVTFDGQVGAAGKPTSRGEGLLGMAA